MVVVDLLHEGHLETMRRDASLEKSWACTAVRFEVAIDDLALASHAYCTSALVNLQNNRDPRLALKRW